MVVQTTGDIDTEGRSARMSELALELGLWMPGWAQVASAIIAFPEGRAMSTLAWDGVERRNRTDRRGNGDRRRAAREASERRSGHDRRRASAASA